MIKFKNLKEALEYQEFCPTCNTKLDARITLYSNVVRYDENHISFVMDLDVMSKIKQYFYKKFPNLFSNMSTWTHVDIKINILTGKIKYSKLIHLTSDCHYERAVIFGCQNDHYDYIINFYLNFKEKEIYDIHLYCESIALKSKNKRFDRITNYYDDDKTTYFYKLNEPINLPLIQFNLNNISETISKVQKLIIFA